MTLTAFPTVHCLPCWGAAAVWGIPQLPGAQVQLHTVPDHPQQAENLPPAARCPSTAALPPCSGSQCSAFAAQLACLGLGCGRAVLLQALRPFLSSLHPLQQTARERGRGEPSAPQAQEEQAQQGGEGGQRGWHPGGRGAGQQGVRAPGGTCSYGSSGAAVTFHSGFILCFLHVFFPKGRGPGSG